MQSVEENQIPVEPGSIAMDINAAEVPAKAEILDMDSVKRLQSLNSEKDPDFFARLVEAFLSFGQKNINSMNEAIRTNDLESIGRYAHALKGSCSNFGAMNVVNLCIEIEKNSAARQWTLVARLVARATNEFTLITHMLKVMIGSTEIHA